MVTRVCPRFGAGEGARLRPPFRLRFGAVVFDLMPDGWVRVVTPRDASAGEFRDLAAFLADARSRAVRMTKGGA